MSIMWKMKLTNANDVCLFFSLLKRMLMQTVIYQSVKSNAIIWKYRNVYKKYKHRTLNMKITWAQSLDREKERGTNCGKKISFDHRNSTRETLFEFEPRDWKHDQRIRFSVGYSFSTVQLQFYFSSVLSALIRGVLIVFTFSNFKRHKKKKHTHNCPIEIVWWIV